ncbi:amidohydrolase [Echinicola strongylocentroti]|uniref:Amidohydrolase n=1 Tax=Echinicola strongylocentroti TaxID=1795355 RepID=A0A2Z4IHP6_9BACT|nr:amidohydrolase [Echinicola strongylocentroti]AWW30076.1 amidohydrolase [Echinicola strongylocentroti]
MSKKSLVPLLILLSGTVFGQSGLHQKIDDQAASIESKVIEWRRDIHENPELGNQETRTAQLIATHLKSLGIEVKENIAVTGVVGLLKGGLPGPTVALRADMDALPVTERNDLPFKSTKTTTYNGQEVGVMHACGHDTHVAILLGVAEVLSSMKGDLHGTVKFIFQPAEEGVFEEGVTSWGAKQMVEEGVMEGVDAVFGLHINSQTEVGDIKYRSGPAMAAVDNLKLTVNGRQAHGAYPWSSVDPIVTSSQIINALQTIISRNVNITENPAIVTIGSIHGGVRQNIIPEKVEMLGTIRTYGTSQQELIHQRIREIATKTGEAAGANVEVTIDKIYPATINDPALTEKMVNTLKEVAGEEHVIYHDPITGAEDFSYFQQEAPGLFIFLGGMPKGTDPTEVAAHHTPDFFIDESGLLLGVRALSYLAVDYMETK